MARPKISLANDFLLHLNRAGVIPVTAQRVVIDAKLNDVVRIYVEQIGTQELLAVIPDELRGVVVIVGDKEALPNG